MSIVYKAKHQTTSEIVALKKINTEKEANGVLFLFSIDFFF